MTCTYCGKPLDVMPAAYIHFQGERPNVINTRCCGKPVSIQRVVKYNITEYIGDAPFDDWGNEITQNTTKDNT